MKKKSVLLIILVTIGILLFSFLWILPTSKANARRGQQQELARNLGVRINDYPYPTDFPAGYFYAVLKPGMTYKDVHNIVRGYQSVYQCYGTDEIYYYFSNNGDEALRFALYYDKQGNFVELQGEDPNSRTLGLGPGCSIGPLGK